METIKAGNYYTLKDMSIRLGISRMAVLNRAKKLKIMPVVFGRLYTRYHESDVKMIFESYGIKLTT